MHVLFTFISPVLLQVYRENFLGFIRLTTVGWPELDDPAIALSASTEVHAALRPVMIAVLGAESKFWSRETIAASTAAFFKDRTKIDVKTDFEVAPPRFGRFNNRRLTAYVIYLHNHRNGSVRTSCMGCCLASRLQTARPNPL